MASNLDNIGLTELKRKVETMKEIAKKRAADAASKQIADKAIAIATALGESIYKTYGTLYIYNHDNLEIEYDSYVGDVTIKFLDRVVFNRHLGDIDCYVPSERWESILDKYYTRANSLLNEKERKKLVEELNELIQKWGPPE